jgi:tRNA pseudouridine38/39 synthase
MASPSPKYDGWSREELIARLTELDPPKKQRPPSPKRRVEKEFNFAKHPTRKIALKFCYSGWEYSGLAFQNMKTVLPTVEGVLFDALVKSRLIDAKAGFEGCGWEKCGRTDRGVSAAGQVISLWVRSAGNRDDVKTGLEKKTEHDTIPKAIDPSDYDIETKSLSTTNSPNPELNYIAMLNRLLPPTIRILAWSPVSPEFSARFSCSHRHYKYFFTSDLVPGPSLDIDRMRAAAARLIGEHDFRNLCKVDPGKQITVFKRTVMRADIEPVSIDENGQGVYVFNLIGSAFLYHQVRHIMAVLFMVGSGVEHPSIISTLMNVDGEENKVRTAGSVGEADDLEVVICKPEYQMADALPLMLWDCGYPEGVLDWRTTPSPRSNGEDDKHELFQQLHSIHSRSQIVATLNDHFLTAASHFHSRPPDQIRMTTMSEESTVSKYSIPLGGGAYKTTIKYTPLLRRPRLDPVELINERWRVGKGFRRNERKKLAEGGQDDTVNREDE